VETGDVQDVIVYNGAETGSITFTISFSGASTALASVGLASAIALVSLF